MKKGGKGTSTRQRPAGEDYWGASGSRKPEAFKHPHLPEASELNIIARSFR